MKGTILRIILIIQIVFITSCSHQINKQLNFEIKDFEPFINFSYLNDTLFLPMDLDEKITTGVSLPSVKQSESGFFKFSFKIKNKSEKPKKYSFRLFYQNESYKLIEYVSENTEKIYNPLSSNNFYGSWGYGNDSMHTTELIPADKRWHTIVDSFKIVGNPRNEKKYFGGVKENIRRSDDLITNQIKRISNDEKWLRSIKIKAKKNNYSLDHQLFLDALWIIRHDAKKGNKNNRWKRNPRVGNYSFSIIACEEEKITSIPKGLRMIETKIDSVFVNPYFDLFYNQKMQDDPHFIVLKANTLLKTMAKFNLNSGIYSNEMEYRRPVLDSSNYCLTCGNSNSLFLTAQFEQHFHREYYNYPLSNIPVSYNVVGDNYTSEEYEFNRQKFEADNRIYDVVHGTHAPCKTVLVDTNSHSLKIITPGNSSDSLKKENVALRSRIGFTYGRHIAKIKFPEMLSDENIWNGLTCAYWLLYQNEDPWNNRNTECNKGGYLEKGIDGPQSPTSRNSFYSEIDFEILKTSKYWPGDFKLKNKKKALEDSSNDRNIIIACTNWDLACKNPENFSSGAKEYTVDNESYKFHRWDEWYKALTLKHPIAHDKVFGDYYYYVIDWEPDKITWSIGKDEDNLKVIAKVNQSMTMVPDNQMIILFSQEFHPGEWWPLAPYKQNDIPYPSKDLIGEIIEMRIE